MRKQQYKVAVIGLGAMGALALQTLSQKLRGEVIGIEAHDIPHTKGSYHGETRLFRMSYHEGSIYVPFLQRAEVLWRSLEKDTGQKLFFQSGAVYLGQHGEGNIQKPIQSAEAFSLSHRLYKQGSIAEVIPGIQTDENVHSFFDESAGYILSEKAVEASLDRAQNNGATIRKNAPVQSVDGCCVTLKNGEVIYADHIVVTAGAYVNELCPFLKNHVKIVRATVARFKPKQGADDLYSPDRFFPFVIKEEGQIDKSDRKYFYGFPDLGHGVKMGCFNPDRKKGNCPDDLPMEPQQEEVDRLSYCVKKYFPHLEPAPFQKETGLMADTEDENFIIDQHPDHKNITVVSACSGHGFKFAPVIAEMIASHVLSQTPLPEEFKFKG